MKYWDIKPRKKKQARNVAMVPSVFVVPNRALKPRDNDDKPKIVVG